MNWVTIRKFSELTGYTEQACRDKMRDGVWLEGSIWTKAPDARVLISLKGYETWVERREFAVAVGPASGCRLRTGDSAAARG